MSDGSAPRSSDDARSEILRRVDGALRDRPPAAPIPRDYRQAPGSGADVADLFAGRVSDYRATVHRTTPEALAEAVDGILSARGVRRLVVPRGIPDVWLLAASDIDRLDDEPPLSVHELDGADGVITGCTVAIAETGTIVLDGGPGQGRRALSLLPDYHLCVVRSDQVAGTVPEAVARVLPSRPLTWISGPSATSDIELSRVEGVHGPRVLDVILVEVASRG